jgi:hypothetical protein
LIPDQSLLIQAIGLQEAKETTAGVRRTAGTKLANSLGEVYYLNTVLLKLLVS